MGIVDVVVVVVLLAAVAANAGSVGEASPTLVSSATTLATSFVMVVNQSAVYNETVSVPVWQRLDTSAPLPGMVVADDFTVPTALQTCRLLVADLVLFRQLGRVSNYRVPVNVTLWIYAMAGTGSGPFDPARALYQHVFSVPSGGAWDPLGSTGGKTVDHGAGYYYHMERLRFTFPNVTVRAGLTYWLAALVSVERAYNVADFSQNTVRWALSEVVPGVGTVILNHPYRVVDWHGNVYHAVPALKNWTTAATAEPTVLPWFADATTVASATRQLAMDIYLGQCTNVTRLPASVHLLQQLPAREGSGIATPAPTPSSPADAGPAVVPSPTPSVVVVGTASPLPSSSSSSSPSRGLPTPLNTMTSSSSSPSRLAPLAFMSSSMSSSSSSSSSPSPLVIMGENPVPALIPTSDASIVVIVREPTPLWMWSLMGGSGVVAILICGALVFLIARWKYKMKFTDQPLKKYYQETANDSDSREEYTDAKPSLLASDDGGGDVALDDIPTTPEEAAAQHDFRLMRQVKLNH